MPATARSRPSPTNYPPALLADQIGLSVGAAAKWSKATAATRGTYVGLRAK
ncbi:hypothetical protein GCM10027280_33610 [Micromonospora polyrhachis]